MTQINYKALIENAMLSMVRDILKKISQSGLPKNHHFLITFFSNSNGVVIPDWMKEKYPEKMTIIIRNWFENLIVTEKKFEISLNFNNTVEHLTIPFSSLELFADPSVDFAISFNQSDSISSSETKIKEEKSDENADKNEEKPSTKNKNVIDLKKFKK
tara:strand:- start:161 stop:634 length:474 start_codon:yes stop_codon:yes gene_type:complete